MPETEPKDGFFDSGALRLHYADWGGKGRRPMALLHGLGDSAHSWNDFAQTMSADFRVLALDARGHGDSARAPTGHYRFEDHVSDLAAFFDHLDLRDAVLVGHSVGGRYAWSYAVQHPDSVSALVIVDIDPDAHNPQTDADIAASLGGQRSWRNLDEVVEYLRIRQTHSGDDSTLTQQAIALTKYDSDTGFTLKADIRTLTEYERPDIWNSWRQISCPVLLVRGRQSKLLDHRTAVRMREALPTGNMRLAEIDGGGHWFHMDFPGAFEATVRWFLSDMGIA